MNIFTKVFHLFLLVFLLGACQHDDLFETNSDNHITTDIVLGKGKGTKKSVSSARARPELQMIVPLSGIGGTVKQTLASSLAHNVKSIDVRIEETEGAIPVQELITLEKIADNGTNARFKATGVDFEEGFIPNLALNAQLTFRDEEGNAINEEPFEAFPTAQLKNGIYLRNLKIKCELSGACVFTLKVKGGNASQVAYLQGFVSNEAGDMQDVVFTRTSGGNDKMEHVAQENPVFEGFGGRGDNVLVSLTAYNTDGNILDSNIEIVAFPEIDFGPQVGKLKLTEFGNSEFYLAETSIRATNRTLVTETSITVMQDFSTPQFYDMPRIATNENRDLYWRTFDGLDFNLIEDLGTTMFGLALDEDEQVLDIKMKQIEVQQAPIMPVFTSELSRMQNGNLQYDITFNEPQDTELITWVVFNDGSGTEKGRYKMTPSSDNSALWTAKNIKPSNINGLTPGETVTALTCRFDRGVQAVFDGRLDGEELTVPDNGISYEFSETRITKISGGGIRIKGIVIASPTAGSAPNAAGPATSQITVPQGNLDGSNLIMELALELINQNPDVYSFEDIYDQVNTNMFDDQFETSVTLLDEANQELVTQIVLFDITNDEDTNTITVPQVSLSQNEDGVTFALEAEVTGDAISTIDEVVVFITPQDGGSDADPADFTLTLVDNTFDGELYRNNFVTFADPDAVIGMEYLVEFTFNSADGNQLKYLETIVIGSY